MAKKKLKYIEDAPGAGEDLRNVNAKVEASLYDDFQKCVQFAKQQGKSLSITKVIKTAMREAIDETRQMPEAQGKLDL